MTNWLPMALDPTPALRLGLASDSCREELATLHLWSLGHDRRVWLVMGIGF